MRRIPQRGRSIHITNRFLGADATVTTHALAEEPLSRRIPWLQEYPLLHEWRLRLQYQMHLSTSSLFLNKKQRRQLGLPENIYPWFPLMTAGPRFVWYTTQSLFPASRHRLEKLGRMLQRRSMKELYGEQDFARHAHGMKPSEPAEPTRAEGPAAGGCPVAH